MATAFPPIHTHSTTRVSTAHARDLLSTYLTQSLTSSSLHPNALLTESGPTNPSGTHTGLIIHNLQRIEAGLRGENLGADIEIGKKKKEEGLEEVVLVDEATGGADAVVPGGPSVGKVPGGGEVELAQEEWQDRSEFEREQEDVQGEIGDRDPATGKDAVCGVPRVGRGDKAERKKRKEERRKKEKKEREESRRKKREGGAV